MGWQNIRGAPPDYDQSYQEMLMLVDEEIKLREDIGNLDGRWLALRTLSEHAHANLVDRRRSVPSPLAEIIEEVELRGGW